MEPTTILDGLACPALSKAEGVIHKASQLVGATLVKSGLRREYRVHMPEVVSIKRRIGSLEASLLNHSGNPPDLRVQFFRRDRIGGFEFLGEKRNLKFFNHPIEFLHGLSLFNGGGRRQPADHIL